MSTQAEPAKRASFNSHALDSLQITHIFRIRKDDLKELFDTQLSKRERLQVLDRQHQGVSNLVTLVSSNEHTGIQGDERDLNRRK